jgi:hypothetical protein
VIICLKLFTTLDFPLSRHTVLIDLEKGGNSDGSKTYHNSIKKFNIYSAGEENGKQVLSVFS